MQIIYNLSIYLYLLVIRIASLFNSKAKLWVSGRKNQELSFDKLRMTIGSNDSKSKIIWFHCASLGEFEQARPLIESLKFKVQSSKLPADLKIVLTFFSPSGYEIRKNYQYADYIFYLPIDTPSNARKFIETINPTLVFFVKYEFWFNYLQELKRKNIPTYLVSGIFRENHYFFKAYSNWFRRQLKCFTHFFLQDEKSMELLKTIGYTNTTFAGDTRFDRVADIAANVKSFPLIEQFKQDKNVFICGSTWAEDEKIICHYFSGRHPELVEGQQQKENNMVLKFLH